MEFDSRSHVLKLVSSKVRKNRGTANRVP